MRRPHWTPVVAAAAALALGGCGDPPASPTTAPPASSAPVTTPTTVPVTSAPTVPVTTAAPPTTLAGGGWAEAPVVTSPWGALGWWDGEGWVDALEQPGVDLRGRYRLLGLLGSDGAQVDSVGEYCQVELGGTRPLPELPWGAGDPFPVWSLALSAPWEVGTATVLEADAAHVAVVRQHLAVQGLVVETPTIVSAIGADLAGDGVPDTILVAEEIADPVSLLPTAGDYSVVLVIPDGDPEQSSFVLGGEAVVLDPEAGDIPFLLRVPAVADLNGDGTLEVAVASAYYEGVGIGVFGQVEGVRGLGQVLGAGCGA